MLAVAIFSAGFVVAAERADATVVYNPTPIAGWSTNGPVRVVKVVGDRVYAGGTFTQVRPPGGGAAVARQQPLRGRPHHRRADPRLRRQRQQPGAAASSPTARSCSSAAGSARSTAPPDPTSPPSTSQPARCAAFNPRPQSSVITMALQGDRLYIGGFFNAVNNVPRGRVALVNKDTGALDPTFNPNADGDVRALAIAPDQSRLYVGGSFLNIAGTAQAELVALDPITGIRQPIVFQQFVGAPLELEVDPSGTRLYARLVRLPGRWQPRGGMEHEHRRAAVAQRGRWATPRPSSTTPATLYFGFHEGYGGDVNVRNARGRCRLRARSTPTSGRPSTASWASGPSTAGNNTLAVGGEFTNFDGRQVQGLALLPSLYANDQTPPTVPANLSSPSRTATSVSLSWNASTDNTLLTGYEVLRNGQLVGSSTTTSFTDTALTPATAYTYQVRALDAAGNRSAAVGCDHRHHAASVGLRRCELALPRQRQRPGHGVARLGVQRLDVGERLRAARLRRRRRSHRRELRTEREHAVPHDLLPPHVQRCQPRCGAGAEPAPAA